MKVLIVGGDKTYAIENLYARYLPEYGLETRQFAAQSIFYDYYQRNIRNKLLFKTGLSPIIRNINKKFLETVDDFRPDIVWVFKGMEIFPSSLETVRSKGIRTVNYNPDSPFVFTGNGSGNRLIVRSLTLYHLHLTYNLQIRRQLEEERHLKAGYLPFGFDLDDRLYRICAGQPEVNKLCFLGNPDRQRSAFIMELAGQGIAMDIYGNHWDRFLQHPAITLFPPVYKEDFWKTLRRYRVQLNLMRVHNEDSHNMRTFEVPGVGGIMLAPSTTEHKLFFTDGEDAFFFTDVRDCAEKIGKMMRLSAAQADEVRQNARQRSLRAGYSYLNRAGQAAILLGSLYE